MTKTELLEAILAELKAIHALLDQPADLPTPADDYEAMAALVKTTDDDPGYPIFPNRNKADRNDAGRY